MNRISTFTLKGKDIDLLYNNGALAYSFEHNGKAYGNKVELPSKKVMDIASAVFLLLTNALETSEALENGLQTTGNES